MEHNYLLEDELAERAMKKKVIADKWDRYTLLDSCKEDPWAKLDLALILENQRLHISDPLPIRMTIPIAIRIWNSLKTRELASVQPLLSDNDCYYQLQHAGNHVSMRKTDVRAKDRLLKTFWNLEPMHKSCNVIDDEAYMCDFIAQEVALETDRRTITQMCSNAATVGMFDFNAAFAFVDTIKENYELLYVKLVEMSNAIGMKNGRGQANWIVTSPEIASIFEAYNWIVTTPADNLGIQYVGTVNGKWRLYKDPLFPTGQVLLGYKGNHPYDSGYFFCPHVLLKPTPVVLDPDSLAPRRRLMTEYADRMDDNTFYGRLNVQDLII